MNARWDFILARVRERAIELVNSPDPENRDSLKKWSRRAGVSDTPLKQILAGHTPKYTVLYRLADAMIEGGEPPNTCMQFEETRLSWDEAAPLLPLYPLIARVVSKFKATAGRFTEEDFEILDKEGVMDRVFMVTARGQDFEVVHHGKALRSRLIGETRINHSRTTPLRQAFLDRCFDSLKSGEPVFCYQDMLLGSGDGPYRNLLASLAVHSGRGFRDLNYLTVSEPRRTP